MKQFKSLVKRALLLIIRNNPNSFISFYNEFNGRPQCLHSKFKKKTINQQVGLFNSLRLPRLYQILFKLYKF